MGGGLEDMGGGEITATDKHCGQRRTLIYLSWFPVQQDIERDFFLFLFCGREIG